MYVNYIAFSRPTIRWGESDGLKSLLVSNGWKITAKYILTALHLKKLPHLNKGNDSMSIKDQIKTGVYNIYEAPPMGL